MAIHIKSTVLQGCSEETHPSIYRVLNEFSDDLPENSSVQLLTKENSPILEIKVTIEGHTYRLWVDEFTAPLSIREALRMAKDQDLVE